MGEEAPKSSVSWARLVSPTNVAEPKQNESNKTPPINENKLDRKGRNKPKQFRKDGGKGHGEKTTRDRRNSKEKPKGNGNLQRGSKNEAKRSNKTFQKNNIAKTQPNATSGVKPRVVVPAPPPAVSAWKTKDDVAKKIGMTMQINEDREINGTFEMSGSPILRMFHELELSEQRGALLGGESEADSCENEALVDEEDVHASLQRLCRIPGENDFGSRALVCPKGIKNPGNICFANSVIQALLGSSIFAELYRHIGRINSYLDSSKFPVLHALSVLASKYSIEELQDEEEDHSGKQKMKNYEAISSSLLIKLIYFSFKTRYKAGEESHAVEQEDAHEFLHCLLDSMHEEILKLRKTLPHDMHCQQNYSEEFEFPIEEDGWLTQSGKRAVKQQVVGAETKTSHTVISAMFEGMQATSIASKGCPHSVTMHPFLVVEIPLYNPEISSISQAIDSITATEIISGYRPQGRETTCDASKSERFQSLPPVLILHLMRFQFAGSSEKLNKKIHFDPVLHVKTSWLTPGSTCKHMQYELVSTVSHHGQSITSGHYTSNVKQHSGGWLHFDDEHIFTMKQEQVLNDCPYLLFYQMIQK